MQRASRSASHLTTSLPHVAPSGGQLTRQPLAGYRGGLRSSSRPRCTTPSLSWASRPPATSSRRRSAGRRRNRRRGCGRTASSARTAYGAGCRMPSRTCAHRNGGPSRSRAPPRCRRRRAPLPRRLALAGDADAAVACVVWVSTYSLGGWVLVGIPGTCGARRARGGA